MTLAIALRARDGLVMAADSRMTITQPGQPVPIDFSDKFLQVNRDVGIMTYGLAVPGFAGMDRLVQEASGRRVDFATYPQIVNEAQAIFQEAWQNFIQTNPIGNGQGVGFIIGGYDMVERNQFRVHSFHSNANFQPTEMIQAAFLAAQWHISQYLADLLYSEQMVVRTVSEVAVMMLTATMEASLGVGGPIQLATVTTSAGFHRVHEEAINDILRRNEVRFARLQEILLREFLAVQEVR
jgi:20S proteasome alpha/beta subunit